MKADFKKKLVGSIKKKKCGYCFSTEKLSYDHKVPLSMGGKNVIGNIQVLCQPCNTIKSSMSHRKVLNLARWVYKMNKEREKVGKRPLGILKNELGLS